MSKKLHLILTPHSCYDPSNFTVALIGDLKPHIPNPIQQNKTMDLDAFEQEVKQELKKLDHQQIVHFAWRCAVRALPFLGNRGNFDFWDVRIRQKHLYAVFYALDVNAARAVDDAARAVDDAARAADTYAEYAADTYDDDADDAADAAYASANAYTAYTAAYAAAYTAAINAYGAGDTADISAKAARAANIQRIDLTSIILQDLETFQEKERSSISTDIYGEIWDHFQKALAKEGCAYWGNLYQQIFANGSDFL